MNILSTDGMLAEMSYYWDISQDLDEFLNRTDSLLEVCPLNEAEYNQITQRLELDILDVDQFVKNNNCKCVSDPRAFSSNNIPSPNGLLSNEIFGYTMEERRGTFAYIDLHGWFMDPSCYKTWTRLDSAVKNIIHGTKYYRISAEGLFIEDEENGDTGIDWLKQNMKKIKFKPNESASKQLSIQYLEANRDRIFINKYIIIPPFYRDKNTTSSSRKTVGLGGINKIYNNLIVASNALTASQDFGFDASYAMQGRVQELILTIYDWFCGNRNSNIAPSDKGTGMSSKMGIMRRTNMSKTANFSTRLVISAAELKVDRPEDLLVDHDKSMIPLYAVITQFRDFVMYHTRLFFENEFRGSQTYPVTDKNGNQKVIIPQDPEITFSDERIKKEMDRFLHGYNNRFVPVEIPVEGTDEIYYMRFKGRGNAIGEASTDNPLVNRRLTWCDIFYMAAVEATMDKQVLITRFPMDNFSNQFTTGVTVASTKETEYIEFDGKEYKNYPKIREEDIGKDTSNSFIDTLRFSNLYLNSIGGDFDGDQCTCKGVYTREANDELKAYQNSKANFVTFGCAPLKVPGDDSVQAMYALTKILSTVNVTPSDKITYA